MISDCIHPIDEEFTQINIQATYITCTLCAVSKYCLCTKFSIIEVIYIDLGNINVSYNASLFNFELPDLQFSYFLSNKECSADLKKNLNKAPVA